MNPKPANRAVPLSPPRAPIGASCGYRRDAAVSSPRTPLESPQPTSTEDASPTPTASPASTASPRRPGVCADGSSDEVEGGSGVGSDEETVASRWYPQEAPMQALGGDLGAARFACSGELRSPLVSLPRSSFLLVGSQFTLGRFDPHRWCRRGCPRSRTPRRTMLKSAGFSLVSGLRGLRGIALAGSLHPFSGVCRWSAARPGLTSLALGVGLDRARRADPRPVTALPRAGRPRGSRSHPRRCTPGSAAHPPPRASSAPPGAAPTPTASDPRTPPADPAHRGSAPSP